MNYFKFKRQEVKYYTLEQLESGESYSWSELKRYVEEKRESEINDSTFTNALQQLVDEQIVVISGQGYYKLVKESVARKEDFLSEDNLNSLLEKHVEEFTIKVNQLLINTMEQFISDINELPKSVLRDNKKLSKDILPLRINDYKKKIEKSKKMLRKMANDL